MIKVFDLLKEIIQSSQLKSQTDFLFYEINYELISVKNE